MQAIGCSVCKILRSQYVACTASLVVRLGHINRVETKPCVVSKYDEILVIALAFPPAFPDVPPDVPRQRRKAGKTPGQLWRTTSGRSGGKDTGQRVTHDRRTEQPS